jgi:hypothetical protein
MKKISIFLMVSVMVLSLFTGCAGQPVDKNTNETVTEKQTAEAVSEKQTADDVQPEPTSEPTSAPTPEPEPFAPADIFGSEFNPFYNVKFPQNFDIYNANFNIGNPKFKGMPKYVLSMTAEGDTDETIKFLSKLAGIEDENSINKFIEEFNKGGFCEFKSTDGGTFTIRRTDQKDDRYQYVEGCHIDLWVDMDSSEAPRYIPLVSDNYNINALSVAADYFDVTPDFDECGINVDLYKNFAEIGVSYDVKDTMAVQQKMAQEIKSNWYDPDNGKMGLSYGMIDFEILFDNKGGQIYVNEKTSDMQTALGDYTAPEVSLSTLGFYYAEKDALCIYEDKKEGIQVAICKPEWGARPTTDNNWNIQYLHEMNGYLLVVWYYANEQKYSVQADKGSLTARYDYFIETGEYGNEWTPDTDTVKEHFCTVFDTQEDDVFAKAVSLFEQTLKDCFDISLKELYALPIR